MDIYTPWNEEEGLRAASAFMENAQRPVIVHLSDTFTGSYDMALRLLEIVRPELTIHTGDMADEFKAGRIAAHVADYRAHASAFLAQIERLSGRVWLTPGNNDVPGVLLNHGENTAVWSNGARVEAFGVRMELDHYPIPVTTGVDFALYGHGPTDDLRYPLPDAAEETVYLNGNFFFTLIEAKTRRFVRIPFRWPGRCRRLYFACCPAEWQNDAARRKIRYLAKVLLEKRFAGKILYTDADGAAETARELAQRLNAPYLRQDGVKALDVPLNMMLEEETDLLLIGDAAQTQDASAYMLRRCSWRPDTIPASVPGSLSAFRIVDYVSLACHALQLSDCAHMPMALAGRRQSP